MSHNKNKKINLNWKFPSKKPKPHRTYIALININGIAKFFLSITTTTTCNSKLESICCVNLVFFFATAKHRQANIMQFALMTSSWTPQIYTYICICNVCSFCGSIWSFGCIDLVNGELRNVSAIMVYGIAL